MRGNPGSACYSSGSTRDGVGGCVVATLKKDERFKITIVILIRLINY